MAQSTMRINFWGNKVWSLPNGNTHREDGPAIICTNGTKYWFINGLKHREDGPAVVRVNGSKEWWVNDRKFYQEDPSD